VKVTWSDNQRGYTIVLASREALEVTGVILQGFAGPLQRGYTIVLASREALEVTGVILQGFAGPLETTPGH
jgi:hypothetical protein